jgi:hypothetical protein
MFFTAQYLMFLICEQIHYEGKWEGFGHWKLSFFWALKWQQVMPVPFGPKIVEIFMAQPPPTCLNNGFAPIKNIAYTVEPYKS